LEDKVNQQFNEDKATQPLRSLTKHQKQQSQAETVVSKRRVSPLFSTLCITILSSILSAGITLLQFWLITTRKPAELSAVFVPQIVQWALFFLVGRQIKAQERQSRQTLSGKNKRDVALGMALTLIGAFVIASQFPTFENLLKNPGFLVFTILGYPLWSIFTILGYSYTLNEIKSQIVDSKNYFTSKRQEFRETEPWDMKTLNERDRSELEAHIAERVQAYIELGETPEQAALSAYKKFGVMETVLRQLRWQRALRAPLPTACVSLATSAASMGLMNLYLPIFSSTGEISSSLGSLLFAIKYIGYILGFCIPFYALGFPVGVGYGGTTSRIAE
jgi:hypothetical protein